MLRLSKLATTSNTLVRSFIWQSGTHGGVALRVVVEYVPPQYFAEQKKQAEDRIIGRRAMNPVQDLESQTEALNRWYIDFLASRVKKIEGLTLRSLAGLVAVNAAEVAAGGGLDAVIPLDATDPAPLDADTLAQLEKEKDFDTKTNGDMARKNIADLLKSCRRFNDWLSEVISDVSWFQDADWENDLKKLREWCRYEFGTSVGDAPGNCNACAKFWKKLRKDTPCRRCPKWKLDPAHFGLRPANNLAVQLYYMAWSDQRVGTFSGAYLMKTLSLADARAILDEHAHLFATFLDRKNTLEKMLIIDEVATEVRAATEERKREALNPKKKR